MENFAPYYIESNLVCVIVFGILLIHNHFSIDRQEKQIKFDHALIAFMLYFLADSVWAAITGGLLPKTPCLVFLDIFLICNCSVDPKSLPLEGKVGRAEPRWRENASPFARLG